MSAPLRLYFEQTLWNEKAVRVAGFASDAGVIELELQAGYIGFLQQSVVRSFIGPARSHFRPVDEAYGRQAVLRSELVGAR